MLTHQPSNRLLDGRAADEICVVCAEEKGGAYLDLYILQHMMEQLRFMAKSIEKTKSKPLEMLF